MGERLSSHHGRDVRQADRCGPHTTGPTKPAGLRAVMPPPRATRATPVRTTLHDVPPATTGPASAHPAPTTIPTSATLPPAAPDGIQFENRNVRTNATPPRTPPRPSSIIGVSAAPRAAPYRRPSRAIRVRHRALAGVASAQTMRAKVHRAARDSHTTSPALRYPPPELDPPAPSSSARRQASAPHKNRHGPKGPPPPKARADARAPMGTTQQPLAESRRATRLGAFEVSYVRPFYRTRRPSPSRHRVRHRLNETPNR